jgi:hypothetical protein
VYDTCIQMYRARHHWMAFIDADEFFVLRDARVPDLPALLAEYEHFGALAVNWQARRPGRPERFSQPFLGRRAGVAREARPPAPPWLSSQRDSRWTPGFCAGRFELLRLRRHALSTAWCECWAVRSA